MPKLILIVLCTCACLGLGLFLRWDQIHQSPMHADEATGARILSLRSEGDHYIFNPTHFHGPLLSAVSLPLLKWRGEPNWKSMRASTLRWIPFLAGGLMLALGIFWHKTLGWTAVLAGMLFMASSPILVVYSRIYIHENLLALVSMATLTVAFTGRLNHWRILTLGLGVGLMFATKETFVISLFVWSLAILGAYGIKSPLNFLYDDAKLKLWSLFGAGICMVLVSAWFYSDGFRQPQSYLNAFKTFFVYKTGDGHDKPFYYYLNMLAWPKYSGGRWWHETGVALLVAVSPLLLYLKNKNETPQRLRVGWFLWYSVLGHIAIYSFIQYKTPWLMVFPWAQACLLAGLCLQIIAEIGWRSRVFAGIFMVAIIILQSQQAHFATHRYSNDARNPYIYVPTSFDVFKLERLLKNLNTQDFWPSSYVVAVVGRSYWPLPWYLRMAPKVGYWDSSEDLDKAQECEVVLVMPSQAQAMDQRLEASHELFYYGLRDEFPLSCWIKRDLWQQYLEQSP